MRNKILMTAAAAFVLSSVSAGVSVAQIKPSEFHKDSEKKDPAVADTAGAKSEAKVAKKQASTAEKKAKTAESKAKKASKEADKAAKDAAAPQ